MIVAFVTVFLGLMAGPRTVEVAVGEPVAQVEILLDGTAVGILLGEPWTLEVDFGDELQPHRLMAVARDAAGGELGRADQWINLPRPAAEAQILLESQSGGPPRVARLVWSAAVPGDPQAIAATLDGEPLAVVDPRRIELPEYDPGTIHVLRADLRFSETVEAVAEAAFGGAFGMEVSTEMQALAVAFDEGVPPPGPVELSGWLTGLGEPLEVRAVEAGPADVVMVVDLAAGAALRHLHESNVVQRAAPTRRPRADPNLPGFIPQPEPERRRVATTSRIPIPSGLHPGDRLRCVRPVARSGEESGEGPVDPYTIFPVSDPLSADDGGIFPIMTRAAGSLQGADSQRLADAVAVAGIQAYGSHRRRVVVLVVGSDPVDHSRFGLPAVRRYLSRLQVPLAVWTVADLAREVEKRGRRGKGSGAPGTETPGGWKQGLPRLAPADLGPATDVSSLHGLKAALRELRRQLDHQRVLWIDGLYLPQQVDIASPAAGLRWAGS